VFKKAVVTLTIILLGTLTVLLNCAPSKAKLDTVDQYLSFQAVENEVIATIAAGCSAAAMESGNEQLMLAVMMSRGTACMQISGQEIGKVFRKESVCAITDEKCLFTVGYLSALLKVTPMPENDEDLTKLKQDIETNYSKLKTVRQ
jgi:hypothetical protein